MAGSLEGYAEELTEALTRFWQGENAAEALRGLLSRKVIWHDSLLPGEDLRGPHQVQALVWALRSALPDLRLSLQRPLALGEDGVLLGYWRARGTHTGPLGTSLPPSGAVADWEGSVLVRTVSVERRPQHHDGGTGQQCPLHSHPGAEGEDSTQTEDGSGAVQLAAPGDGVCSGQSEVGRTDVRQGVEVWWSWDPAFLFRQLGWQPQQQLQGELGGSSNEDEATVPGGSNSSSGDGGTADGGADGSGDMAGRTAAAAGVHATEAAAVEAATAAVAAAAAAAARFRASAESLAAAQAANRAVVELYFHTYNTGRYAVLDHIVHPDYQYDGLLDIGERRGRAAMTAMMSGWRACLPDLVIGHELFAAVGPDKVTFRWVIRGTHSTPGSRLLGVAAGSARLHVMGVTTLTLREGRIVRKISHANAVHTLQQLGAAVHPVIPLAALP